jgi:hypothetical protein
LKQQIDVKNQELSGIKAGARDEIGKLEESLQDASDKIGKLNQSIAVLEGGLLHTGALVASHPSFAPWVVLTTLLDAERDRSSSHDFVHVSPIRGNLSQ